MKHPPDFTPRAFATALRYRYALAVVLMGGVLLALPTRAPDLSGPPLPQATLWCCRIRPAAPRARVPCVPHGVDGLHARRGPR